MTPIVGMPIIKGDGRYLCYSCAQDEEWVHGKDDWMPEDAANYPVTCDVCGQVLIHDSQAVAPPPKSSSD